MKIFLSIFCIIFFSSNNLLASDYFFCKHKTGLQLSIEIEWRDHVYTFQTYPAYYWDNDKYTAQEIPKGSFHQTWSITWDTNFIKLDGSSNFRFDKIGLLFYDGNKIYHCQKINKQY